MITRISVQQLHDLMTSGNAPLLLDVRNDHELEASKLNFDAHIPLPELEKRAGELDASKPWVVYCRVGARSYTACQQLEALGYQVSNLEGGINAWAEEIDPSMPTY